MKFPKNFELLVQTIIWTVIIIYITILLSIYIPVIVFATIITILRLIYVGIYHNISKKARAFETITRIEFNFWKLYSLESIFGHSYEEYLQMSLNLSERKLDEGLKNQLIKTMKKDWEEKSILKKILYFFKCEDCDFDEGMKFIAIERVGIKKGYCFFCKKITDNEKQKDDIFCVVCGRQRGLTK